MLTGREIEEALSEIAGNSKQLRKVEKDQAAAAAAEPAEAEKQDLGDMVPPSPVVGINPRANTTP